MPAHAQGRLTTQARSLKILPLNNTPKTSTPTCKAAEDPANYAKNPLWQTVSGPEAQGIHPIGASGPDRYQGGRRRRDKATFSEAVYKPFTPPTTPSSNNPARGRNRLRTYPAGNIAQKSHIESQGYRKSLWQWLVHHPCRSTSNYPESGLIFLKARAPGHAAADRPESISKVIWKGMAALMWPVPQEPGAAGTMDGCAHKFDPGRRQEAARGSRLEGRLGRRHHV